MNKYLKTWFLKLGSKVHTQICIILAKYWPNSHPVWRQWWQQSGKFSFQFCFRPIVEVDAAMAGTLPRTQAGSQQYNPVGLEVGNHCQTFFILTLFWHHFLNYWPNLWCSAMPFPIIIILQTRAGSLSCEQQGEVDQWDRRGDDLRRCCQGDFFNIDLLDSIGLEYNIYFF